MLYTLSFQKAFGLKFIPHDYTLFFVELGIAECNFSISDKRFTVKIGKFGVSEKEKFVISCFFHSDERDLEYIDEIMTLDITFNVDLTIPETLQESYPRNTKIDGLVAPFIQDAFGAASRFIDAYRSAKYNIKHRSEGWKRGAFPLMPEMAESEFKTYLFYKLQNSERTFVGCFSDGRMTMSSSEDFFLITQQMQNILQDEISLSSKLIVKTWAYWFQEDYRNCVIYAATVLELIIIKFLRKSFISKSVASDSQIDKFLENVSNRLLCTVIFGLIGVGDEELREKIASVFEIRNGLIHGKRKKVSQVEAKNVLAYTEELLELLEKNC